MTQLHEIEAEILELEAAVIVIHGEIDTYEGIEGYEEYVETERAISETMVNDIVALRKKARALRGIGEV